MSDNPYSPPLSGDIGILASNESDVLAGRFTRLAASIVDGILMVAIIIPIMFAAGYFSLEEEQEIGIFEELAMSLLGIVVMLVLNGYLLATRGQTIGKLLIHIQIVDVQGRGLLSFVRVYVFRYLWMLPLWILVALIPGSADDLIVNVVTLVDVVLIFGPDRRCLHDYIAGSKVVLYQANRPRAE